MKNLTLLLILIFYSFAVCPAQITINDLVQIVKAEDARRYDSVLEEHLKSADPDLRARAALAAGRIGDDAAIPLLVMYIENDASDDVRVMSAFAIGEIESVKAADVIIRVMRDPETLAALRARAVEAAGKIAAANSKDSKAAELGAAIVEVLKAQDAARAKHDRGVVAAALTAALRARPNEADVAVSKFLTSPDGRIRADAANTLARLRAKNANDILRAMLRSDSDAVARANAARALGAAEDKLSLDALSTAAVGDNDSRVRVSAIRALISLKDPKPAERLIARGEKLFADYKRSAQPSPSERSELLEIAIALGRLLANTKHHTAASFLQHLASADDGRNPEISIARIRIAPADTRDRSRMLSQWYQYRTWAETAAEYATLEPQTEEIKKVRADVSAAMRPIIMAFASNDKLPPKMNRIAAPDFLRAYAKFKTPELGDILREAMVSDDVFLRTAAAELIAEQPASEQNINTLLTVWNRSQESRYDYDDDQLAILDALYKLDKKQALSTLIEALNSPDYVVRKKAFDLLREMQKDFPEAEEALAGARSKNRHQVSPYTVQGSVTKLGQVLNTDADYRRALSRKNGQVRAVVTTAKGTFNIELLPEDAPLTVDNFVKLAKANFFNGVEVHRVVPNFVMQDGDPRGDGNGGPGWSIRCEINMVPYDRGAVGMALSGKDTGGSQWFVTHSPQPHLDGGYTVFGRVNETDMHVVDNIVRGDKIFSVKIVEPGIAKPAPAKRRRN